MDLQGMQSMVLTLANGQLLEMVKFGSELLQ